MTVDHITPVKQNRRTNHEIAEQLMTRKNEVKVMFTEEDVRLINRTAARWGTLSELSGIRVQSAEPAQRADFERIASAIEAELKREKQKLTPTNLFPGLHPSDDRFLRTMVEITSDAADAAALRDLAKRVKARAGTTKTYKAADGGSVTFTAGTTNIKFPKGEKRRRRK